MDTASLYLTACVDKQMLYANNVITKELQKLFAEDTSDQKE